MSDIIIYAFLFFFCFFVEPFFTQLGNWKYYQKEPIALGKKTKKKNKNKHINH